MLGGIGDWLLSRLPYFPDLPLDLFDFNDLLDFASIFSATQHVLEDDSVQNGSAEQKDYRIFSSIEYKVSQAPACIYEISSAAQYPGRQKSLCSPEACGVSWVGEG